MAALVSIIMPVYNAEKYVAEAIASVLQQSYTDWELIIVDDGSIDGSSGVISRFDDPRIIRIRQLNAGVSAARNAGLALMKGDFFCFLDADDLLPPSSIHDRIKIFKSSSDIAFVDGIVHVYDDSLQNVLEVWKPKFDGMPFKELIRLKGTCFFGMTWMFRRDRAIVYRFCEGMTHGEDLLFYIEYASSGRYVGASECTFWYRKNKTSAMSNMAALGAGYRQLGKFIFEKFSVSKISQLKFWMKTRKIMFLSFIDHGEYWRGTRYLVLGY
jgi:glycosyltransferase involved in cell wall biosynthesis